MIIPRLRCSRRVKASHATYLTGRGRRAKTSHDSHLTGRRSARFLGGHGKRGGAEAQPFVGVSTGRVLMGSPRGGHGFAAFRSSAASTRRSRRLSGTTSVSFPPAVTVF